MYNWGFIEYYSALLGTIVENKVHVDSNLVRPRLLVTEMQEEELKADFNANEVKQAM